MIRFRVASSLVFLLVWLPKLVAGQDVGAWCECKTGKAECLRAGASYADCVKLCGVAVPGSPDSFVKDFHRRDGRCWAVSRPASPPCSRPPAPGVLPEAVKAALSKGRPVLATFFYADDTSSPGNGQCEGAAFGRLYAPLGEWTPQIRIDADGRPGGCCQAWLILDPKSALGSDFTAVVNWSSDGGDAGQCGNPGSHQIPIWRADPPPEKEEALTWSPVIRIDTDNRNGGCLEDIGISGGPPGVRLEVEFGPDGDGQCEGGLRPAAVSGTPIRFRLDTDDRAGGCRQRFRLVWENFSER